MQSRGEKNIPKRLRKEPLLEAVWELRFQSDSDAVEGILPGIILGQLQGVFEAPVRLPAADIPPAARAQQPIFNYAPAFRLSGKNAHSCYDIQIGPRAVTLNCRRPYPGWNKFKAEILKLAGIVRKTGLIAVVERFSLKYVDLIPAAAPDYLSPLNGEFRIGGHHLGRSPLQVQSQLPYGDFIHILTLLLPARVEGQNLNAEGLLIDIDTVYPAASEEFWDGFEQRLDAAHDSNHRLFFDILKQETVELLEPEFDRGGVPL
jgi:uncharacterized protein (TIGR04255 family)